MSTRVVSTIKVECFKAIYITIIGDAVTSAQSGGLGADAQIQARKNANNANEVLQIAQEFGLDIAGIVAEKAAEQAKMILKKSQTNISVIVVDRSGKIVGQVD